MAQVSVIFVMFGGEDELEQPVVQPVERRRPFVDPVSAHLQPPCADFPAFHSECNTSRKGVEKQAPDWQKVPGFKLRCRTCSNGTEFTHLTINK